MDVLTWTLYIMGCIFSFCYHMNDYTYDMPDTIIRTFLWFIPCGNSLLRSFIKLMKELIK